LFVTILKTTWFQILNKPKGAGEGNLSSNLSVREVKVKKIGLDWFNHLEDLLNFHKMYIDTNSNYRKKIVGL